MEQLQKETNTMTKKDYELIARVISTQLVELERGIQAGEDVGYDQLSHQVRALRNLAYDLSENFGYENTRFKPVTFLKACGMGGK